MPTFLRERRPRGVWEVNQWGTKTAQKRSERVRIKRADKDVSPARLQPLPSAAQKPVPGASIKHTRGAARHRSSGILAGL